jgi:hypothetical protein
MHILYAIGEFGANLIRVYPIGVTIGLGLANVLMFAYVVTTFLKIKRNRG